MEYPTKPGGGNKPEPYIPAGNGEKSGEYTNKEVVNIDKNKPDKNCYIRNRNGLFNPRKSTLVKRVDHIISMPWGHKIPTVFKPNSVIKKIVNGCIEQERYFDEKGETYLEIHYTNHGNPKTHPRVPHIHRSKIINGIYQHAPWEEFRWKQNA